MPIFPAFDELNCRPWPPKVLARQDEWEAIAQDVFDGRKRAADADQWAATEGLPPFVPPLPDPAGAFAWPQHVADASLSLALAWIAFRHLERAAWAHERRWAWGRAVDRDPPVAGQILDRTGAERQLWEALRLGRIEATGRRPSADRLRNPGPLVAIVAEEWRDIVAFHDGDGDMVGPDANLWIFAEVSVPKDRLFSLWPAGLADGQRRTQGRRNVQTSYRGKFEELRADGIEEGMFAALVEWAGAELSPSERMKDTSLHSRISEWRRVSPSDYFSQNSRSK